jgi:hypothetical protein
MNVPHQWSKADKHLIMLAMAWSTFSILVGIFLMFDSLESGEAVSFAIIHALEVAGIFIIAGLVTFCLPLAVYSRRINKKIGV